MDRFFEELVNYTLRLRRNGMACASKPFVAIIFFRCLLSTKTSTAELASVAFLLICRYLGQLDYQIIFAVNRFVVQLVYIITCISVVIFCYIPSFQRIADGGYLPEAFFIRLVEL